MSEPKFTIREATLEDMPKVMILVYKYLKEFEKRNLEDETEKDILRRTVWGGFLRNEVTVVVAETQRKKKKWLSAYGIFDLRPNIFLEMVAWGHQLYVEPKYRNTALAGDMLKFGEQLARKTGAEIMYIDTPFPQYFVERFNYKPTYEVVSKDLRGVKE